MSRRIIFVLPNGREFSPNSLSKVLKPLSLTDLFPPKEVPDRFKEPEIDEYLDGIPLEIANLIKEGQKLERAHLDAAEITAVLRLGGTRKPNGEFLFPNVTEALQTHFGLRGLPIKLFAPTPSGDLVKVELRKHQIAGITHIRTREEQRGRIDAYGLCGSIVKMQMGLGKTLVAIAWSLIAPRPPCPETFGENGFPTLVIASKTVMIEWKSEGFEKFFGNSVRVLYFHKSYLSKSEFNQITRREIAKYDFVVTTYDTVLSAAREGGEIESCIERGDEHTLMKGKIVAVHTRTRTQADGPHITGKRILFHTPWERVIADESQRFANPDTLTYKAIMAVYGRYKLCLTGTPIRNYSTDIWAQLRWCGYTGVARKVEWKRSGIAMMQHHQLNRAILALEIGDTDIVLPDKITVTNNTRFVGMEKTAYEFVLGVAQDVYDQVMANMVNFSCILALFTRLRQMCIAPYLITAEAKREKPSANEKKNDMLAKQYLQQLYHGPISEWIKDKSGTAGIRSTKMQLIIQELKEIPEGEKVVIFSMFTSCLDLLADAIKEFLPEDYVYEQMDGDTPDNERAEILQGFRKGETQALLMTYKVGSEGLNLTRGNHIICIEPWWTYAVPSQAEARCHRPGQTRDVYVHNLYIEDSIEQRVLEICEDKKVMAENYLEGVECKMNTGIDKYTLGRILGRR